METSVVNNFVAETPVPTVLQPSTLTAFEAVRSLETVYDSSKDLICPCTEFAQGQLTIGKRQGFYNWSCTPNGCTMNCKSKAIGERAKIPQGFDRLVSIFYKMREKTHYEIDQAICLVPDRETVDAFLKLGILATCTQSPDLETTKKAFKKHYQGSEVYLIHGKGDAEKKLADDLAGAIKEYTHVLGEVELDTPTTAGFFAMGGTKDQLCDQLGKVKIIKGDGRAITSKENGQKGGRDPFPILQIAVKFNEYAKDLYNGAGLRFYRESWYKYGSGYWWELPETDFKAILTKFIQDKFATEVPRISHAVLNDVTLNLKSMNLCFLPSVLQEPFYISGARNETALFNMKNGLLDRSTKVIKPHTPDLFSTVQLPYDFRPDAKCPRWEQYLKDVQVETPENIRMLKLMFGLCLIPETRYCVAFYLYGEGGTGKSVCLHILTKLIGEHNICCIPLSRFGDKFGLAPLTTKLINVVGESPFQTKYNELAGAENTLKEITDGGIITIEQKMKNRKNFSRC